MSDQPRLRAGDADRDHVLGIIQSAYESGRLDLEEMQERQERALRAKFTDELPELVADLPEGQALATMEPHRALTPEPRHQGLPATGPADGGFHVAIMSGRDVTVESGTEELACLSFWGGNNYHLTEAMGPGRRVTLSLHAIMGGCNVYVPEGVRVIDESIAIMAGNEINEEAQGDGSNGTLVLKGLLWWGGNEVKLAKQ